MNTTVIDVPSDSCPFQILSNISEETTNAWIFIHKSIFNKLRDDVSVFDIVDTGHYTLKWKETDNHPKRSIKLNQVCIEWFFVTKFKVSNIAFVSSNDPADIFFIK